MWICTECNYTYVSPLTEIDHDKGITEQRCPNCMSYHRKSSYFERTPKEFFAELAKDITGVIK